MKNKKLVFGSLTALSTGCLAFLHKNHDLNGSEMIKEILNSLRISKASLHMAYIYKNPFGKLTIEEKHNNAGLVLCNEFRKCGGIYIKLGQNLALMDVILPVPFCSQFYE